MAPERIERIDVHCCLVEVGAGARIAAVEEALGPSGLTLGPLCPGVRAGTVAQWVEGPHATLRAIPGGRLEPAAIALEATLRSGAIYRSHAAPRSAAGPDLDHLLLGGGGVLGSVTRATLRASPAPPSRETRAIRASDPGQVVRILRDAMAHEALPAVATVAAHDGALALEVRFDGLAFRARRDANALVRAAQALGARALERAGASSAPVRYECEVAWEALPAALELLGGAPAGIWRIARESVVLTAPVWLAGDGVAPLQVEPAPAPWLPAIARAAARAPGRERS